MAEVSGEGLAGLLAALESEAEAELDRFDAEVRREAAALLAAARAEAEVLERHPVEEQEPELARETARVLATARLEAERVVREARAACCDRALEALRRRLEGARDRPGHPALHAALRDEARAALPGARTLRVDPRDVALARDARLAVEPTLTTAGGVVLEDGEGRTVVNTLEERLRNAEPVLREALARVAGGAAAEEPDSRRVAPGGLS